MMIHPVRVTIGVIDTSAANWDAVFKRAVGALPETVVTLWAQVHFGRDEEVDPAPHGDSPRTDGYLLCRRPLPSAIKVGDVIRSVDGETMDAPIVEIGMEAAYGGRQRMVRIKFRRVLDRG